MAVSRRHAAIIPWPSIRCAPLGTFYSATCRKKAQHQGFVTFGFLPLLSRFSGTSPVAFDADLRIRGLCYEGSYLYGQPPEAEEALPSGKVYIKGTWTASWIRNGRLG